MAHSLFKTLTLAAAVAGALTALPSFAQTSDPVIFTFSTVGDTRTQNGGAYQPASATPVNLTGQDAHWLQNSKAWGRIQREALAKKSKLMVVNGDLIMGYGNAALPVGWTEPGYYSNNTTTNGTTAAYKAENDYFKMNIQYAFWRGMAAGFMEQGMYYLPVAGNHEVQCSTSNSTACGTPPAAGSAGANTYQGSVSKFAVVGNENAWRQNMADLIIDSTRLNGIVGAVGASYSSASYTTLGTSGSDLTSTDQSALSYSFDLTLSNGDIAHFVVINTDPVGVDSTAPTSWLATDLSNAAARNARHFFVFGHKPAFTYDYSVAGGAIVTTGTGTVAPAGLDLFLLGSANTSASTKTNRDTFWNLIAQYGATYFSGHEHTFNMQPIASTSNGTAWQVLVGGGGSAFDPTPALAKNPYDRYYSWATVSIHASGAVDVNAWGFDENFDATKFLGGVTLPH